MLNKNNPNNGRRTMQLNKRKNVGLSTLAMTKLRSRDHDLTETTDSFGINSVIT